MKGGHILAVTDNREICQKRERLTDRTKPGRKGRHMYQVIRAGRQDGEVLRQDRHLLPGGGELEYLTFPSLEQTGVVRHLITTRTGGVSQGDCATMNLSFSRGDEPDRVLENYRRVGEVLGCGLTDMVTSHQTHTTHIRRITEADRGKGVVRERDYQDVDGLVTDVPGLALVTYYADCVPLLFVDPVCRAVGLAHSGWKGTAGRMAIHMVRAMEEQFGSRPEDLMGAVGPSICQECYEVGEDVARQFARWDTEYDMERRLVEENGRYHCRGQEQLHHVVEPGRRPGKYQLDLWLANLLLLCHAGIPLGQIAVTDICTCHNSRYLFSHRASGGKRGNLAAFLMLQG